MSDWIKGKPFNVTSEDVSAFNKHGRDWSCSLCGHKFKTGDVSRWVYANGTPGAQTGNFFVCLLCDGEDVIDRAVKDLKQTMQAMKRWRILE